MDVQPEKEFESLLDGWPEQWEPRPSGRVIRMTADFIAAHEAIVEDGFTGERGWDLFDAFASEFDEATAPDVFRILFFKNPSLSYALLSDTRGEHIFFRELVTSQLTGPFFVDFLERALKDTTQGNSRLPLQLAETVALLAMRNKDVTSLLEPEVCASLLLHCHLDFLDRVDSESAQKIIASFAVELIGGSDGKRGEILKLCSDSGVLAFLHEWAQRVFCPPEVSRDVWTCLVRDREFTPERLLRDDEIEAFLEEGEATLNEATAGLKTTVIRYSPEYARSFASRFAARLPEAVKYLYYNHPSEALTVLLSTKGMHERLDEMLSACPPDAPCNVARRELADTQYVHADEREAVRSMSGGTGVKLLLREGRRDGAPFACFNPAIYHSASEMEFASFLEACYDLDVHENGLLRRELRDALRTVLRNVPGRQRVGKNSLSVIGLYHDEVDLVRAGLLDSGYVAQSNEGLSPTDLLYENPDALAAVFEGVAPYRDRNCLEEKVYRMLRRANPMSPECRRWLDEQGVSRSAMSAESWVKPRPFSRDFINMGFESQRRGFESTERNEPSSPEVEGLFAAYLEELKSARIVGHSLGIGRGIQKTYSQEASDLFFSVTPVEHRGALFAYLYHRLPDIGGVLCRTQKHHARTLELFSELSPEEAGQVIEQEMFAFTGWEDEAAFRLFRQFDNCALARTLFLFAGSRTPVQFARFVQGMSDAALGALLTQAYVIATRLADGRVYDLHVLSAAFAEPQVGAIVGEKVKRALCDCDPEVGRWVSREVLGCEESFAESAAAAKKTAKAARSMRLNVASSVEMYQKVDGACAGLLEHLESIPSAEEEGATAAFRTLLHGDNSFLQRLEVSLAHERHDPRFDKAAVSWTWFELAQAVDGFFEMNRYKDWGQRVFDSAQLEAWTIVSRFMDDECSQWIREKARQKDVLRRDSLERIGLPAEFCEDRRIFAEVDDPHSYFGKGIAFEAGVNEDALQVLPEQARNLLLSLWKAGRPFVGLEASLPPRALQPRVGRLQIVDGCEPALLEKKLQSARPGDIVVVESDYPSEYSRTAGVSAIITGRRPGEHAHAYHRAKDLGVGLLYLPGAPKALSGLHDTWVCIEYRGREAALRAATEEEVAEAVSKVLPEFTPDKRRGVPPIIECGDAAVALPHTVGAKAAGIAELIQWFPGKTDNDSFAWSLAGYAAEASAERGGGYESLDDVIRAASRRFLLTTPEGCRFASMFIQSHFDRFPLDLDRSQPQLLRRVFSVFGDDQTRTVLRPFMMRGSLNVEDRKRVSAAGATASYPVLPGAKAADIYKRLNAICKGAYSPELIYLREELGLSQVGSGIAIEFESMPDFMKHMVLSAHATVDATRIAVGFCVGHGNYLMAEGHEAAFTAAYDVQKGTLDLAPAPMRQAVKHVPTRSLDKPYEAVELSPEEKTLLDELQRGVLPDHFASTLSEILDDAVLIFQKSGGSDPQENEFTLERTPDSWKVRYRQKRPAE